jgi:hypothetical protein
VSDPKVVPFKPREAPEDVVEYQVWTCNCGSDKWQMLNDGLFRCAECHGQCSFRWFDPREKP